MGGRNDFAARGGQYKYCPSIRNTMQVITVPVSMARLQVLFSVTFDCCMI